MQPKAPCLVPPSSRSGAGARPLISPKHTSAAGYLRCTWFQYTECLFGVLCLWTPFLHLRIAISSVRLSQGLPLWEASFLLLPPQLLNTDLWPQVKSPKWVHRLSGSICCFAFSSFLTQTTLLVPWTFPLSSKPPGWHLSFVSLFRYHLAFLALTLSSLSQGSLWWQPAQRCDPA